LAVAFVPGCAVALCRDTSELVATAFAIGGVYLLRRQRWLLAAVVLAAAALTRETTLIVPIGVAVTVGLDGLRRRRLADWRPVAAAGAAFAAFALWQLFLWRRWGELPVLSGNAAGELVTGFVKEAARKAIHLSPENVFDLAGMVFIVAFIAAALWVAWRVRPSAARSWERAALVAGAVVVISLATVQWEGHTGYDRASAETTAISALVLLGAEERWVPMALAASVALWVATALVNAVAL
jgi:hypothetical protein